MPTHVGKHNNYCESELFAYAQLLAMESFRKSFEGQIMITFFRICVCPVAGYGKLKRVSKVKLLIHSLESEQPAGQITKTALAKIFLLCALFSFFFPPCLVGGRFLPFSDWTCADSWALLVVADADISSSAVSGLKLFPATTALEILGLLRLPGP